MPALPIGAVLRLARDARDADARPAPLVVVGPLAPQLATALAAQGDPSLVLAGGDPRHAAAVVCVLGGAPTPEQERILRTATRAGTAVVGVQTGDPHARVPYVLAEHLVACPPGEGFPVGEIATALVAALDRDAAPLAARLPTLRPAAERLLARRGAARAAAVAVARSSPPAKLPVLVLLQAALLRDLEVTRGRPAPSSQQEVATTAGVDVGAALATGLAARALVRRLPFRNGVVEAAVAGAGTLALAALAARARAA